MAKIIVTGWSIVRGALPAFLARAWHKVFAAAGSKEGAAAAASQAKTAHGGTAGLVLIADDDADTRRVIRRYLTYLDVETFEAKDGFETLEFARARRPDIILLDIFMPKKDGVEVLKELAPEMPGTGFIMITGNADEDLACKCLEFGAIDYISKPINLEALGKIIKARLLSGK